MEEIKIEKKIPMPVMRTSGYGNQKYPWADMKVGDSFVAPVNKNNISNSARAWAQRHRNGWEFAVLSLGSSKARIWRVK